MYTSSVSISPFSSTGFFFYHDPFAQLRRHCLDIAARKSQFRSDLFIGKVQAHEIETNHPYPQGSMMPFEDGPGQIVKLLSTGFTFIALTIVVAVMMSPLFDVC
jgi:hypothetical protein